MSQNLRDYLSGQQKSSSIFLSHVLHKKELMMDYSSIFSEISKAETDNINLLSRKQTLEFEIRAKQKQQRSQMLELSSIMMQSSPAEGESQSV